MAKAKAYTNLERTQERDPRVDPWEGDLWKIHLDGAPEPIAGLVLEGRIARLTIALLPDLTYVLFPVVEVDGRACRLPVDIRDPRMASMWASWEFFSPSAARGGPPGFGTTLYETGLRKVPGTCTIFVGHFAHPKGENPPDPIDRLPNPISLMVEAWDSIPGQIPDPTPQDVWAVVERAVRGRAERQIVADKTHALCLAQSLDEAQTTIRDLRTLLQTAQRDAANAAYSTRNAQRLQEDLTLAREEVAALQAKLREMGDKPVTARRAPSSADRVLRDVLSIIHPDTCKHPKAAEVTAQVNDLRDSFRALDATSAPSPTASYHSSYDPWRRS